MRADILVPRTARLPGYRASIYIYSVPDALAAAIAPGQLVAVPFGEQTAPGIVWALDASDEASSPPGSASDGAQPLRPIADILLTEPLMLPTQRALAEWLADYYVAPLAAAARLMLPPGLLPGLHAVVHLREESTVPAAAMPPSPLPADSAIVLGMLRGHGRLDRAEIERALGKRRATQALAALVAQQRISLAVELSGSQRHPRLERMVRLTATAADLDAWRDAARARLDALPEQPAAPTAPRARRHNDARHERQAERLLRQLAVLDVLSLHPRHAAGSEVAPAWRLEELRRLSRATDGALAELVTVGLIAIDEVRARHDPMAGSRIPRTAPLRLTPEQSSALAAILDDESPASPTGRVFLLHGITGSGKTEVYLQALAAVIARGRRGLVLVPEIALTPQAMARFAGRFPGRVALLHSGLTDAERLDEWRRIRAGEVDVVLGSRSALFAPVDNLGLIVVDEEHEAAYKEEQRAPTYHARDAAVHLGALVGATVVLGSATPSIDAYAFAASGIYRLIELRERAPVIGSTDTVPATAAASPVPGLPPVAIVDLRAELRAGNTSILSESLRVSVREVLERGEQAILFLNRRGMASSIVCRECGYIVRCGRCDVSMTLHAAEHIVLCHYCGKREPVPETCPVCWSASIRYFGVGTERVEAAVKRLFPTARVLRWDRDTARTRHAHEELLRAFASRRADILVGTQMIAKGLDLPGVTLVGVISADVALFLPDFRASERAFQLLTQVAGRAGRGDTPGRVLVQTFNPEHFCVQSAARHDYHTFFAAEASARERYGYPPYRRFVKCTYENADRYSAQIEAAVLYEHIERIVRDLQLADTDVVGPAPAFMERLRGRYRWQVILRSPDPRPVLRALARDSLPRGWSVDLDPATSL
jgi:primosomal protein N' (replication factor Y)